MKKITLIIIILLVALFVILKVNDKKDLAPAVPSDNPPNSAENAPPGSIHNLPVRPGVSAARTTLATRLSTQESQILILEAIETQWPDACLGIKDKNTVCAEVITNGYSVLMQVDGKEYRYRTNESGTTVKAES